MGSVSDHGEIERRAFEKAAQRIDGLSGNEIYRKAWRKAARAVREMKKLTEQPKELTDNAEQIGSF